MLFKSSSEAPRELLRGSSGAAQGAPPVIQKMRPLSKISPANPRQELLRSSSGAPQMLLGSSSVAPQEALRSS